MQYESLYSVYELTGISGDFATSLISNVQENIFKSPSKCLVFAKLRKTTLDFLFPNEQMDKMERPIIFLNDYGLRHIELTITLYRFVLKFIINKI